MSETTGGLIPILSVINPTGGTAADKELGKENGIVFEPVICHHRGRTGSNSICWEGYCEANSNC